MTHASRLRCDKSRRVGGTARRGAHIMRRSFENATSTWFKEFELSALRFDTAALIRSDITSFL